MQPKNYQYAILVNKGEAKIEIPVDANTTHIMEKQKLAQKVMKETGEEIAEIVFVYPEAEHEVKMILDRTNENSIKEFTESFNNITNVALLKPLLRKTL